MDAGNSKTVSTAKQFLTLAVDVQGYKALTGMTHAQEVSALWDDLRKAAEIIEALRNDKQRLEGERSAAEERCQLLAIHHQDRLEHVRLEHRKQAGDDVEAWQRHVKHLTDNLAEREAENVRQNDDFLTTSMKQEARHSA